jgi:hypothetical protein
MSQPSRADLELADRVRRAALDVIGGVPSLAELIGRHTVTPTDLRDVGGYWAIIGPRLAALGAEMYARAIELDPRPADQRAGEQGEESRW